MANLPLSKLTKTELITLINRYDYSGRMRDMARTICYESRADKNRVESEAISKAIEDNLNEQGKIIPEFNSCTEINRKMKLGAKLRCLVKDFNRLNQKWEKSYKKGNSIFTELSGVT